MRTRFGGKKKFWGLILDKLSLSGLKKGPTKKSKFILKAPLAILSTAWTNACWKTSLVPLRLCLKVTLTFSEQKLYLALRYVTKISMELIKPISAEGTSNFWANIRLMSHELNIYQLEAWIRKARLWELISLRYQHSSGTLGLTWRDKVITSHEGQDFLPKPTKRSVFFSKNWTPKCNNRGWCCS